MPPSTLHVQLIVIFLKVVRVAHRKHRSGGAHLTKNWPMDKIAKFGQCHDPSTSNNKSCLPAFIMDQSLFACHQKPIFLVDKLD